MICYSPRSGGGRPAGAAAGKRLILNLPAAMLLLLVSSSLVLGQYSGGAGWPVLTAVGSGVQNWDQADP